MEGLCPCNGDIDDLLCFADILRTSAQGQDIQDRYAGILFRFPFRMLFSWKCNFKAFLLGFFWLLFCLVKHCREPFGFVMQLATFHLGFGSFH